MFFSFPHTYVWHLWNVAFTSCVSSFRIYDIQRAGHAYTTVPDLIGAMDSSFVSYMKKSIKFVMKTSGFGDTFIDEMVMGALRTNYGQNTEIPGFVGELQKRKKKKKCAIFIFFKWNH